MSRRKHRESTNLQSEPQPQHQRDSYIVLELAIILALAFSLFCLILQR